MSDAIDHEKHNNNKITTAYTINVFKYGDQLVEILTVRQQIAQRLLYGRVNEVEYNQLFQLLEYYNEKIKLTLGL